MKYRKDLITINGVRVWCVCSFSNQNECITSGDACNVATPADEVCTLQCSLVGIHLDYALY